MKKHILSRAFALFMALSLLSTTAFAAAVAEVEYSDGKVEYDQTQFDNQEYREVLSAHDNSTLRLLDDVTTTSTVQIDGNSQTLDLNGFTLTVAPTSPSDDIETIAAVQFDGTRDPSNIATIKDGAVILDTANVDTEGKNVSVVDVLMGLNLEGADISGADDTELTSAISGGLPIVNVKDSVIDAGNAPVIDYEDDWMLAYLLEVMGLENVMTVTSGQVIGKTDDKMVGVATESQDYTDLNASTNGMVVVSDDTAAVVKGTDGKYRTYSDLSKAVEKSDGQPITVLNADDIDKLEVKAGDKLNLVDAKGNSLNDQVKLPDGLELKDGVVSETQASVVDPVTPVTPVTPVDPVTPVISVELGLASEPAAVTVADSEVPLAGPTALADVLEELYRHEGSPDGEDAEGETVKAVAWAIANGIIDEDADVEEIVTVAVLRDVLARYIDFAGIDCTVEIDGEDGDVVLNCGEILTALYASLEDAAA